MNDTAPQIKLKPFFFPDRSSVPWWLTGKGFQSELVPIEQKAAPSQVVQYRDSKQAHAPTGVVSYKKDTK